MPDNFSPLGNFRFDCFNAAGASLGPPLVSVRTVTIKRVLDQISSITFAAPATDARAQALVNGSHVKVYHKIDGFIGEFIIRSPRLGVTQREIQFNGWSLLNELNYYNLWFNRQYNNIAVNQVVSVNNVGGTNFGILYQTGWTQGSVDAGLGNIVVAFQGQSVMQALIALTKRLKTHFREGTTIRTLDFGVFGADSGFRLTDAVVGSSDLAANAVTGIIEAIDQVSAGDEIINKVIPLGAGIGLSQLNLAKATRVAPYTIQTGTNVDGSLYYFLADATSIAAHGTFPKILPFWDVNPLSNSDADIVNAANALYDKANAYLQWYKDDHFVYNVTARQVPAVKLGDKIRLAYRGVVTQNGSPYAWVDLNALYWVMEREDIYAENGDHSTRLLLSNLGRRALDDTEIVVGALQDIQVQQTFVQPYLGRESYVFYEEIDSTHPVTCPIDIDNGVLYLNSCRLRLQTRTLRATTLAASSGGGQTTSAGGGQTSSSSGGATPTSSANSIGHNHSISVAGDGQLGTSVWINFGSLHKLSPADLFLTSMATDFHTHTVTVPAHTHTVSNHSHTVGNHTHGITYGIFDDTAYPVNIRIAIDGTDYTAALGGPWAAGGGSINVVLDITAQLIATSVRSLHSVVFTCGSGQGRIVATVKTLLTTQAIAVT